MDKVRFGIVGCGNMGSGHAKHFMDGKVEILEFKVDNAPKFIGVPIKELKIKRGILIAGITRANKKTLIPSGDDIIMSGDRVIILSAEHRITTLTDILR